MLRPLTFTRVVGNGSGLVNTSKEEAKRAVSTGDAVEVKRFDDVIKYLIREAEILREARSHLDESNKRLDALADKALQ
jgi:hypothetical protein